MVEPVKELTSIETAGGIVDLWPPSDEGAALSRWADLLGFNPDQPRGPDGRWGSGGSSGNSEEKSKDKASDKPKSIAGRLAKDKVGDRHVKEMEALGERDAPRVVAVREKAERIHEIYQGYPGAPATDADRVAYGRQHQAEIAKLDADIAKLKDEGNRDHNETLSRVLNVKDPARVSLDTQGVTDQAIQSSASKARDWLDGKVSESVAGKDMTIKIRQIPDGQEQRAHYSSWLETVNLAKGDSASATTAHEVGHWLEGNSRVKDLANEFLNHRTAGESPTSLDSTFPAQGYRPGEEGRKDGWDKLYPGEPDRAYYTGKRYEDGGTEIISMGLEKMHKDPVHFAKADPEYFKLVSGCLDGRHLK